MPKETEARASSQRRIETPNGQHPRGKEPTYEASGSVLLSTESRRGPAVHTALWRPTNEDLSHAGPPLPALKVENIESRN